MTWTYSASVSSVGDRVRLLIPDRIQSEQIFSNEEISAYLDMEDGNIFLAVADALDTISSDEALVQKVIKLGDLQTNGAATSKVLMDRANKLRERALANATVDVSDLFDWAEMELDTFTRREHTLKDMQRSGNVDWWALV